MDMPPLPTSSPFGAIPPYTRAHAAASVADHHVPAVSSPSYGPSSFSTPPGSSRGHSASHSASSSHLHFIASLSSPPDPGPSVHPYHPHPPPLPLAIPVTPSPAASVSTPTYRRPSSPPDLRDTISTSDLLSQILAQRLVSKNGGDTLDLCHKRIEDVPLEMVEMVRDEVVRLAIGYNLVWRLPDEFAQLTKLRYLNIRANMITVFPTVITELPSLEILDISRNKIRKLPSECGNLVNLRVLSIANNKLRRLPVYIPQMHNLRILKIDQNPIEWPPHDILAPASAFSKTRDPAGGKHRLDDKKMQEWIMSLKDWIAENAGERKVHHKYARSTPAVPGTESDDELTTENEQSFVTRGSLSAPPSPPLPTSESLNHHRPGGMRRELYMTAEPDASPPFPPPPINTLAATAAHDTHDVPQAPASAPLSPPEQIADLPTITPPRSAFVVRGSHGRNKSTSTLSKASAARPDLKSKKSLPDLRQSHADILSDRQASLRDRGPDLPFPASPQLPQGGGPLSSSSSSSLSRPPRRPPTPPPGVRRAQHRQPSSSSMPDRARQRSLSGSSQSQAANEAAPAAAVATSREASLLRDDSMGTSDLDASFSSDVLTETPRKEKPLFRPERKDSSGPVDVERNGYFRRLSTLPSSTISKAIPVPVLKFIDATRGVLFALSQIYTALKQYILLVTDDRVTSLFNRILDGASGVMGTFINALDRFDSLSRRGTPEPDVIRGVLGACRDNVSTFKKLVSVLQLQLKTLAGSADVRYTRTLLLMLYGSTAEISNSWQAMTSLVEAVLPFLAVARTTHPSSAGAPNPSLSATPTSHAPSSSSTPNSKPASSLPSIAEGAGNRSESEGLAAVGGMNSAAVTTTAQRLARTRRNAGSFSVQDVKIGASLPPSAAASQASFGLEDLQSPPPHPPQHHPQPQLQYQHQQESSPSSPAQGSSVPPWTPNANASGPGPATAPSSSIYSSPPRTAVPTRNGSDSPHALMPIGGPSPGPGPGSGASAMLAGMGLGPGAIAMGPGPGSGGGSHLVVDDDLLGLVDEATNVAFGVWNALLDNLGSGGGAGGGGTGTDPSAGGAAGGGGGGGASEGALAAGNKKLRDLRELSMGASDLTRRLQSTLVKVRGQIEEGMGMVARSHGGSRGFANAELKRLWDEVNAFAKVVIQISTLVKSVALEHSFPRPLLHLLGDLTSKTAEVTVIMYASIN